MFVNGNAFVAVNFHAKHIHAMRTAYNIRFMSLLVGNYGHKLWQWINKMKNISHRKVFYAFFRLLCCQSACDR